MIGTIRVNPWSFTPMVQYEPTDRDQGFSYGITNKPKVYSIRVLDEPEQIKFAFDNLGKEVEFDIVSLETDYAKINLMVPNT